MPFDGENDAELLRLERDLYLGILKLNAETALEPFLGDALDLMLRVAGASQGYLEITDELDGQVWWTAAGCSDEDLHVIREAVSRGIIAAAIASGKAVVTPSALLDPRFSERGSVRRSRIEAVVCAPIGADPPLGVLYLQGRTLPGNFSEDDLARAEIFGRHLAPLVHVLFDRRKLERDTDQTHEARKKLDAADVVGRSESVAALLREVALVAPLDVSVLLTGDTGTGKSLLARVIHLNSPRRSHPIVELNCATIPEPLMESELFGAMPGAHSTASHRMDGKIAAAENGTLVLDEITELSISAQAKLLQLLQTREYYPLGSAKPKTADIRLIAATNVDLKAQVEQRLFREDLFYRLQVLPIRVPSLAERREDVELLARHFCEMAQKTHGLRRVELSPGAIRTLRGTTFRGNVRELSHLIEAGTIRAAGQDVSQLEAAHLFPPREPGRDGGQTEELRTFQEETRAFQAQLIRQTLESNGWNIAATARHLDLTRSHVYNLIRSFGLARDKA